jgi:hypothetical protein
VLVFAGKQDKGSQAAGVELWVDGDCHGGFSVVTGTDVPAIYRHP